MGEVDGGFDKRKTADEILRECVIDTGKAVRAELSREFEVSEYDVVMAFRVAGRVMYDTVRHGGRPCTGLPWRWGYGWPGC